jgi:hypothetical protein
MRGLPKYIFMTCLIATFIGCPLQLLAETAELETAQFEEFNLSGHRIESATKVCKTGCCHSFHLQFDRGEKLPIYGPADENRPQFEDVITKDRNDYRSNRLFRGAVQFGDNIYGFAIDRNLKGTDEEESATAMYFDDAGEFLHSNTLINQPLFNRLYFDLNGNGDLTDDDPVHAEMTMLHSTSRPAFFTDFPPMQLKTVSDGTTYDYAVALNTFISECEGELRCQADFQTTVYREGEIRIGDHLIPIALIDYDGNGRFNDFAYAMKPDHLDEYCRGGGDKIYLNPKLRQESNSELENRPLCGIDLAPWISWEGKLYDVTVSASGNTLTLEPSDTPGEYVQHLNPDYSATFFNEQGVMKIFGDDAGQAILPIGEWRLMNYHIDGNRLDWDKKSFEESLDKSDDGTADFQAILRLISGDSSDPEPTFCNGAAGLDVDSVTIVEGETLELPFGPSYRALAVPTLSWGGGVNIEIELVDAMGLTCSGMRIGGKLPPPPYYVVTNTKGEEIHREKFPRPFSGFTSEMFDRAYWKPPLDHDSEYVITIEGINTGPFTVEPEEGAIIKLPPQSDQPTEGMW